MRNCCFVSTTSLVVYVKDWYPGYIDLIGADGLYKSGSVSLPLRSVDARTTSRIRQAELEWMLKKLPNSRCLTETQA